MMRFLASQPVSIAKILDTSIQLYAASFSKLMGFFLIMAGFYIATGLITKQLIHNQPTGSAEAPAFMLSMAPILITVVIIFSLLSLVFYAAMIYRINNVANGREDSFMEALQFGFKKCPALFWAVILYTIAMAIGLLLLVVPGIILGLSMGCYIYFIVIDALGGYASLKASHALVWGHWWRTMTVFMAPGIVLTVFYFTMAMLFAFLGAIGNVGAVFGEFAEVLANLLSAFITPYFFVLGYVQFNDLKLRKSGADLEARLAK